VRGFAADVLAGLAGRGRAVGLQPLFSSLQQMHIAHLYPSTTHTRHITNTTHHLVVVTHASAVLATTRRIKRPPDAAILQVLHPLGAQASTASISHIFVCAALPFALE
jgi:hypothetical protein